MDNVWVFHGEGSRFTSGVFTSKDQAEEFINRYRLTGVLTQYPVGISTYDWAIQEKAFVARKPAHSESSFSQRFSSASQEHYQYDPDDLG